LHGIHRSFFGGATPFFRYPGNQKHRKRALNDFRFAPKPSKAVSSHPKAAEAALRLSLRNG
ncbi:hypothetical protein ACLBVR_35850, partial [Pseudomonas aeruginosa]|uniref:hypothetical protein n=1 Tax=Pseudomonas aeruginosa TaxID=287 RepID=UPI003968B26A